MRTALSANTARPLDEFDAARVLVEVLKELPPDAQERAWKHAQEKLRVAASVTLPAGDDSAGHSGGQATAARHELAEVLSDPAFLHARGVVNKMLAILSAAHRVKPTLFDRVLSIQGRGRRYFARSGAEIADSGRSTQPRKIPGTEYWVMTNSPTSQKRQMLEQVLRVLAFSPEAVREAVAAIHV